jgi:hypothetical protein
MGTASPTMTSSQAALVGNTHENGRITGHKLLNLFSLHGEDVNVQSLSFRLARMTEFL